MIDVRDVITVGGVVLGVLGSYVLGGPAGAALFLGLILTVVGLFGRPLRR
jgi:hypothetical protein